MVLLPNLSVQCHHCGAVDALPHDELGRMLEIKSRLAMAEQKALQVRGVDATLAAIFEDRMAFLRVGGIYLVFAGFVVITALTQMISLPETISTELLVQIIASQAMSPLIMLGIVASFGLALAYGRWHYQRSLRPLLVARLPVQQGAHARCRVCGGDLPEARGVDVRCNDCRSVNLIPKALHGAQANALAAEADALRRKLTGVNIATMSIGRRMRNAMILFLVLTFVVAFSLPMLARVLTQYVEF